MFDNVCAFLESFGIEECEISLCPIRKYLPICVISNECFVACIYSILIFSELFIFSEHLSGHFLCLCIWCCHSNAYVDLDQQLAEDPRFLEKYLSDDESPTRNGKGHSKKITIKSSILPDGVRDITTTWVKLFPGMCIDKRDHKDSC